MFSDSFDSFDLIITDVIMPKMNGTDLHRHIKAISPDSKILFISGYIENSIIKNEIVEKGLDFIQKPFDLKVFLRKIRDIIETKFLKVARKKPGQLAR